MKHATILRTTVLACALATSQAVLADAAQSTEAAAAAPQAAALPPLEAFFDNPAFSGAALSPSGKYLAAKVGGKDQRERLAVVDLATSQLTVVANFVDADVGDFHWVSDERLVYDVTDRSVGPGDARYAPGLYAVNRDGNGFRQLINRSNRPDVSGVAARLVLPYNHYLLRQKIGLKDNIVYVQRANYSGDQFDSADLLRLDTVSGTSTMIKRPGKVKSWLLDQNGEPRIAATMEQGETTYLYLDPASNTWNKLASFHTYKETAGAFTPLEFGPDGTLYVLSSAGRDTQAVYTFNFSTGKINPQPLVELPGYDFSGALVMNDKKLVGVHYMIDAHATSWLDPAMKANQEAVDALLPGKVNVLNAPSRPQTPWILVNSYSDVTPLNTLLYNTETKKLASVGSTYPAIVPGQMGHQTMVRYKARDGLEIPAWLTLPRGKDKNLPLVVLVHGGPYVRGGHWGWNPDAQFLASRGYAVLEPEFRGSTGFGNKLYRAGWKQWGLAMQNDLADGARWAIAQGTVDPKRICIAGASYGGYATLMGLINDPDLFKCGIDWVGVTDINLLYDGNWTRSSDMQEGWKQYGMPELVGDQVKDAAQLKATSPLLQAHRITQPLLLAYGGTDQRVPLYHGTKFYEAVKATNKNVQWIEYPEEGHGWALPKNRYDFWGRVEKFLDQNIGPKAQPAAPAP
ncbi:alpha/beta hydrolase family protein [Oxalobacteraceae bacterium A2-2]